MHARSRHNGLKTAALLGLVTAVVISVGALFGPFGVLVGGGLAVVMNGIAYFNSDTIALKAMRARPLSEAEHPRLYRIVRELSTAARQPMPRLFVSPTMAPNAFATGRNGRNATVCVTTGILALLDERELRGVLGHELAHVHNRDILLSTVAAGLASVILTAAQLFWMFGGSDDDEGDRSILGALALLVLGPMAASVLQMALSRSREFQADASGAALTGDPLARASALRKLELGTRRLPLQPEPGLQTTRALLIANPFRSGGMARLFSTHPPIADRVARLEDMAGYRRW